MSDILRACVFCIGTISLNSVQTQKRVLHLFAILAESSVLKAQTSPCMKNTKCPHVYVLHRINTMSSNCVLFFDCCEKMVMDCVVFWRQLLIES